MRSLKDRSKGFIKHWKAVLINPEVAAWILENQAGELIDSDPVRGGCIHQAVLIRTTTGNSYFLKQNQSVPDDMFPKEAEGLDALRVPGGPVVPEVLLVGPSFLLLENLQPAPHCQDFWQLYGEQLARLHLNHKSRFGFFDDNYIGSNPQENTWCDDGWVFYREHRYLPQIRWARDQSLLTSHQVSQLEKLLARLRSLVPPQPASLLHGDLWSGNLITDRDGNPALIDPAVYYGWAEADLAMAELFGHYPEEFYDSYREINPLETGYRSRFPVYNLYHLLNHLNLFGGSYLAQIQMVLSSFS